MNTKICVFGAGAVGGWIAARLARQGAPVSVVARGATLAALHAHGLRLIEGGVPVGASVQASDDPAALGVQDVVVVAVKAPSLADVAARIAPLIGPDTVVLTAMNGVPWWFLQGFGGQHAGAPLASVDPGGRIAAAIPADRVAGCVVHASCSLDGPGQVRHHFGNRLIVGEPAGGTSERIERLAALLQHAGFDAPVSPRIQQDVWFKLWGNMTINPISALTGATTDRILADPLVLDFVSRVMREAKAVGAALGIDIDQQPEDRHAVTRKLGGFKTSMLQDVEAARPVELDALVGAVLELGRITGVPTPDAGALMGLARLQAQVRGLYPTST